MKHAGVLLVACCIAAASVGALEDERRYFGKLPNGEYGWVVGEGYYTLGEDYVTPHIKWAKPWARGTVRALIISPRYGHRETVELAQRMSLDYDAIMMPRRADEFAPENDLRIVGCDSDEVRHEYELRLANAYDVIVLGNCQWDSFPPEFENILVEKLENGTGFVLACQQPNKNEAIRRILAGPRDSTGESYIAGAVPAEDIPGLLPTGDQAESNTAHPPLVTCVRSGEGRLVRLSFPSDVRSTDTVCTLTPESPEDRTLPAVLYDYYQALAARAVLWAAQKESDQHLESLGLPENPIDAEALAAKPLQMHVVNSAGKRVRAQVEVVARSWWGRECADVASTVVLPPGRSTVDVQLPRLPGGNLFVDAWLRTPGRGKILDWASGMVRITPKARIESIGLDQPSFSAGSRVTGQVSLSGNVPQEALLRIRLQDSHGRLLAEQQGPASSGPTRFAFGFSMPVAIQHEIVASIMHEHGLIHEARRVFAVSGLVYDDFAFVLWGAVGRNDYRSRMIAQRAYEMGADSSYGYGKAKDWDENPCAYWTTRAGLSQFFYATYLGGKPQKVRNPCFSDPAVRDSHGWRMRELATINKHLGGVGYSTGDEYSLSHQGIDMCWSPTCLAALRTHLEARYGSLEALNRAWETSFEDWAEVEPDTLEQAREKEHYTAWAENRAFNEGMFADIHRFLRETVESVHEGAPVGEEGMFDADTYFGPDWERFRTAATLIHGYERPGQLEHIRSLAPKTAMTGYWWGSYYTWDYAEPKMRWHPWHSLLTGLDSAWWWTASMSPAMSWPAAFNPDLTPHETFEWTMEEVREIKRGIGKLILSCDRKHDRIAILYSMPSIRAADAHEEVSVYIGAEHYPGSVKSAELAWNTVLEDLGLQYEYVSHRDVAKGLLLSGRYAVLILPSSVAMSEGEASAVRAFVRNAGTVIADLRPAIMDEWANPLSKGRLDDVFGVHHSGLTALRTTMVTLDGPDDERILPNRLANPALDLVGADAGDVPEGIPVLTSHPYGQGRAICLNFSINDYWTDWHREEEHTDIRWNCDGAMLREYIRDYLAGAGIHAPITVRDRNARPLIGCEAVFFQHGDAQYLGIEYVPDIVYFARGHESWIHKHYSLAPDLSPVPITISLREAHHVYDMRGRRHLGFCREFDCQIQPGQALMFALLPYRVDRLALRCEAAPAPAPDSPEGLRQATPVRFHAELQAGGARPALHCLRVDIFDPNNREVREYAQNVLAHAGAATFTVPFALNDTPGRWRIVVTDVASGVAKRLTLRYPEQEGV